MERSDSTENSKPMSRAQDILEQLNTLDEHSTIEAKSGLGDSVLETICALANEPGLKGGTIIIGVRLNPKMLIPMYEAIGVENPEKVSSDLASQCASVFNAVLRPRIMTEQIGSKNVVIVDIEESEPSQKPIFIQKKGLHRGTYRRIGSTDQVCTEDDLAMLFGARNTTYFDQTVLPGATFEDIDLEAVEHYRTLRKRVNSEAEELGFSDLDLLRALNAVQDDLRPTLTGILLFGKRFSLRRLLPMMRVDYIRVPGQQWIEDPNDRFTTIDMRGSLLQLVQRAQDSVYDDLPQKFHLEDGEVQAQWQGMPVKVLREAIVNAVMHASYRVNQPIQIIRYSNRIVITNPGYSLKNEDQLGQPGSDLRNPSLAAVFHETNLAETKGSGIRTMKRLMKEAGFAPPLFHSDRANNQFRATLFLHHFLPLEDLVWLQTLNCEELNDSQKYALTIVRDMGMIDNSLYRQGSDCDMLKASRELKKLCELDLLEMRGKGSATYYVPGTKMIAQEVIDKAKLDEFAAAAGIVNTGVEVVMTGVRPVAPGAESVMTGARPVAPGAQDGIDNVLLEIARPAREKKRLTGKLTRDIIRKLCTGRFLTADQIGVLMERQYEQLRKRFLSPMVESGELCLKYPDQPTHSNQAYTATGKGES